MTIRQLSDRSNAGYGHYFGIFHVYMSTMGSEIQELLMFVKDWHRAIVSNNIHSIAEFLAPGWVILGYEGGGDRTSLLSSIENGTIIHNKIETDKMNAVIYGDTGIATTRSRYIGIYNGEHFDLYDWSVCVFIRENEQWKCVSTTVTPAKPI